VNPLLVDWNKNVVARLAPLLGFKTGLMETNGWQSHADCAEIECYHPCTEASWRVAEDGVFYLGEDFYETDRCIFQVSEHYENMLR
jgi:hypothetical protein